MAACLIISVIIVRIEANLLAYQPPVPHGRSILGECPPGLRPPARLHCPAVAARSIERLQPFGLTEATLWPLLHVARGSEPMRQNRLAANARHRESTLVRLIDVLDRAGLIERKTCGDRRAWMLQATPRGCALAEPGGSRRRGASASRCWAASAMPSWRRRWACLNASAPRLARKSLPETGRPAMSSGASQAFGRDRRAAGRAGHAAQDAARASASRAAGAARCGRRLGGAQWLHQRLIHVEDNDAQVAGEVATDRQPRGWLGDGPPGDGRRPRPQGRRAGSSWTPATPGCGWPRWKRQGAATQAQVRQVTVQRDTTEGTPMPRSRMPAPSSPQPRRRWRRRRNCANIARSDFARADPLVGRGDVSRQDWEHARSTMLQNEAALRLARGRRFRARPS